MKLEIRKNHQAWKGEMGEDMLNYLLSTYNASPSTKTTLHKYFIDGIGYTKIGQQAGVNRQTIYQRVAKFSKNVKIPFVDKL